MNEKPRRITLSDLSALSTRPPQVLVAVDNLLRKAASMTIKTPPQPRPDFPPMLRVTSQVDFRHRGGRTWMRTPTEIPADELTDQQLSEIKADAMLTVEEIDG